MLNFYSQCLYHVSSISANDNNDVYIRCPPNYERCPKEAVCIPLAKFCDNRNDCPNKGLDESKCNSTGESLETFLLLLGICLR